MLREYHHRTAAQRRWEREEEEERVRKIEREQEGERKMDNYVVILTARCALVVGCPAPLSDHWCCSVSAAQLKQLKQ